MTSIAMDLQGSKTAAATPSLSIVPLLNVLAELVDLLSLLSDDQYRRKPVGLVPASIGGHVRHCLDHVDAWLAAIDTGYLNYDHRERGTAVETERMAALEALRRQSELLHKLAAMDGCRHLRLAILTSTDLPRQQVETTVGRELAFIISHTIHHNALVSVMARTLGVAVSGSFGYAPSTLADRWSSSCAR